MHLLKGEKTASQELNLVKKRGFTVKINFDTAENWRICTPPLFYRLGVFSRADIGRPRLTIAKTNETTYLKST